MIRGFVAAAAATLAIVATSAFIAPAALALPPNCKLNKVNPYVACTDKLKANTPNRASFDPSHQLRGPSQGPMLRRR